MTQFREHPDNDFTDKNIAPYKSIPLMSSKYHSKVSIHNRQLKSYYKNQFDVTVLLRISNNLKKTKTPINKGD